MFERPHHQRIAQALRALHGPLLRENHCLFGGGTAIALRYGEYRVSVAIDFLVSDLASYRNLRQLVTKPGGIAGIVHAQATPLSKSGKYGPINMAFESCFVWPTSPSSSNCSGGPHPACRTDRER